jgi:general secretion pathway protein L
MAARGRRSPLAAIWEWWLAALGAGLPGPMRRAFGLARERLVVDLVGDTARLSRRSDSQHQDLGPLQPGEAPPPLADDTEIIIRLPANAGLRREVQVPLAAAESLAETQSYQIDRQTPFPADQVSFAHRAIARDAVAGTFPVDLLVAPRDRLRAALARARALGLVPTAMTVGANDEALAFNLLPARAANSRAVPLQTRILWAVAVAALALALATPVFRVELERRQAAQRLATAEAAARPLLAERAKVGDRLEALRLLGRHSGAGIPIVVLLEELTRLLPDDASLSQLGIGQESLELHGTAASAAEVVSRLDGSGRYATISFRSPVVRDPLTGLERFQLSARFRSAAG